MAAPEARIACPLCGGLIHPVAGRCKHCKEDLSATRVGRPAAQAPLPPLLQNHASAAPDISPVLQASPGEAIDRSAVPRAALPARDASAPILPPRPTGRSVAMTAPGSRLRSWPVVVIGLAAVAIVAAVALMVWPAAKPGREAPEQRNLLPPPPAPERMDSDPLPPSDPPATHSRVDPAPHRTPDPLPATPPRNPDIDSDLDIGAVPGSDIMLVALEHVCARLKTCPDTDATLREMCEVYSQSALIGKPPSCTAAKQCLEHIDKLGCSQIATGVMLLTTLPSCVEATTNC